MPLFVCFLLVQLVLKHRQGKNHRMRIVVFIGSPIEDDEKEVYLSVSCWLYNKSKSDIKQMTEVPL